jgi:hypothetical protein
VLLIFELDHVSHKNNVKKKGFLPSCVATGVDQQKLTWPIDGPWIKHIFDKIIFKKKKKKK